MNLDTLLVDRNKVEIQRRITRYDINWGIPEKAVTYRGFIQSLMPAYYFKLENTTSPTLVYGGTNNYSSYSRNTGYLRDFPAVYFSTVAFDPGVVDNSDTSLSINNAGYARTFNARQDTEIAQKGYAVVAWVKYTTSKTADEGVVTKATQSGGASTTMSMVVADDDFPAVIFSSNTRLTSDTACTLDQWNCIVVVVTPEGATWRAKLYLNGKLVANGTHNNYAPSVTDNSRFCIGAKHGASETPTAKFVGDIDEVSMHFRPISSEAIQRIYSLGYMSAYFEPDQEFDTAGVTLNAAVPLNYAEVLGEMAPNHWWKFDSATGGECVNEVAINPSIVFTGNNSENLVSSAISPRASTSTTYAKDTAFEWFGETKGTSDALVTWGTPGVRSAVTVCGWFKFVGEFDDITFKQQFCHIGYGPTIFHSTFAFYVDNNFRLGFQVGTPSNDGAGAIQIEYCGGGSFVLVPNYWYFLTATLTPDGIAELYVDGTKVAQSRFDKQRGMLPPAGTSRLRLNSVKATLGTISPPTETHFDELAIFNRVLTPIEINKLFQVGRYGTFYNFNFSGTPPTEGGSPYLIGQNRYSELTNPEDITEMVDPGYTIERDIKQMVEVAALNVYAEWGEVEIGNKLQPNTYVTIEERYLDTDSGFDSGWESKGHFLVDGPVGWAVTSDGRKVMTVPLRGVMKLLGLDTYVGKIEPDKLFVPQTLLENPEVIGEYTAYTVNNPDVPGTTYYNIAPSPRPRIWATKFNNMGDEASGGPLDTNDFLPIKGSSGSVRIQGGSGEFQFDSDYLIDKFTENGIGDPSELYAEFHRWAVPDDVDYDATINDITFRKDRWYLGTTRLRSFADHKTMWVESGAAKGRRFKIRQYGATNNGINQTSLGVYTSYANVARSGSGGANWATGTAVGSATVSRWTVNVSTTAVLSQFITAQGFTVNTLTTSLDLADIPDSSKIKGIEVIVRRRTNVGLASASIDDRPIKDLEVRISKSGGLGPPMVSDNRARTNVGWVANYLDNDPSYMDEIVYGGPRDNWGFGEFPVSELRSWISTMQFLFAVTAQRTGTTTFTGTKRVEVESVQMRFYIEDTQMLVVLDSNGIMVNPLEEGLAVGDKVTIGDYNACDYALRKVFLENGFQSNDPTKPFYFEFDRCPVELSPSVEPLERYLEDEETPIDVVGIIREFAPPNYRIFTDGAGRTYGRLVTTHQSRKVDYNLTGVVDINRDASDYGVFTRVIAQGESQNQVNVARSNVGGGSAAVHAYQLSGYANADRLSANMRTLTQSEANDLLVQVFDDNAKTPIPIGGTSWNYGNPAINRHYGVLFNRYGTPAIVKRWQYAYMPICAVDIGKSGYNTPTEIDRIEITHFNHFYEVGAGTIAQTMLIYGMTEAAYEAEFQRVLPDAPNQTDTNYFPPADADSWELLVDEFALEEGRNEVTVDEFDKQRPVKYRFLKFVNGQAHFKLAVEGGDSRVCARVTLGDIRVYTSQRVYATAELGVTGVFGTPEFRQLNTRLRRRTVLLDKNLYLDNFSKAYEFAINELKERYTDFAPYAINAFHPQAEAGSLVRVTNPETTDSVKYLVVASSHTGDGSVRLQVVNYDLVLE